MSIFTSTSPQEAGATRVAEKGAESAAGVLPPPASPMYTTRPPAPTASNGDGETRSALAEKVVMARQQQQSVRERVRAGVQRAKSGLPSSETRQQPPALRAPVPRRPAFSPRQGFDPVSCAQAGLLMLAWRWQEAGAPIRAIHAYMELLVRYPGTPAAAAAVADLVELSEKLADVGHFHIALAIYDHLEYLA
jgi:hypothetical protein